MTEEMIAGMVKEITGGYVIPYSAEEGCEPVMIDFSPPWKRIGMIEGLEVTFSKLFSSSTYPGTVMDRITFTGGAWGDFPPTRLPGASTIPRGPAEEARDRVQPSSHSRPLD
jgi:hypothetical protein